MNEKVSFTKKIEFKTLLNDITSISLEHTLMESDENKISGDLIVSGTYRQTEASQIENPFSYKLPVDIELDSKYDLKDLTIDIDDFTYEVEDDNILKVKIDIMLDNLKTKELVKEEEDELIKIDDLFLEDDSKEKLEIREPKDEKKEEKENNLEEKEDKIDLVEDIKEEINNESNVMEDESDNTKVKSLFANLDTTLETYKTYSIYIMKENDTLEQVMEKYKVNRNDLEEYNNLNELSRGSKIIIPSLNE